MASRYSFSVISNSRRIVGCRSSSSHRATSIFLKMSSRVQSVSIVLSSLEVKKVQLLSSFVSLENES